jgi:hypothetical protein
LNHLDNFDLVHQHELTYTRDAKTEVIRTVRINYTGGKTHNIERLGYIEKVYNSVNEFDYMDYSTNTTFLGPTFKIDDPFRNKIKGVVNDHLDMMIYYMLIPITPPHRHPSGDDEAR